MTEFTMPLTIQQIVDALKIHRDQCGDCATSAWPDFDAMPPAKLREFLRRLIKNPHIVLLLAERYEPEKLAALAAADSQK